jgi:hypothetical protein
MSLEVNQRKGNSSHNKVKGNHCCSKIYRHIVHLELLRVCLTLKNNMEPRSDSKGYMPLKSISSLSSLDSLNISYFNDRF